MPKKIFISFRCTGEDPKKLKLIIPKIHDFIDEIGHNHYSIILDFDLFDKENYSWKQIMQKAFREIDSSDIVLFFVNSPKISQGMLIELGYCLAKNKNIHLVIRKEVKEIVFRKQINDVIEFNQINELKEKLKKIF